MTPELIGIIALFGSIVALGAALFGSLKWLSERVDNRFEDIERRMDKRFEDIERHMDRRFEDIERRMDRRFDSVDRRFERIEADISKLKEGQARLEGMFEGAFERVPRARPDPEEAVASSGAADD